MATPLLPPPGNELVLDNIWQTFYFLESNEICACARISKAFREIAESAVFWENYCRVRGYLGELSKTFLSFKAMALQPFRFTTQVPRCKKIDQNAYRIHTLAIDRVNGRVATCHAFALDAVRTQVMNGQTVRLWDPQSDQCLLKFEGHFGQMTREDPRNPSRPAHVSAVTLGRKTGYSACGGQIISWNLQTLDIVAKYPRYESDEITSLCLLDEESGSLLAGGEGFITLFAGPKEKGRLQRMVTHVGSVSQLVVWEKVILKSTSLFVCYRTNRHNNFMFKLGEDGGFTLMESLKLELHGDLLVSLRPNGRLDTYELSGMDISMHTRGRQETHTLRIFKEGERALANLFRKREHAKDMELQVLPKELRDLAIRSNVNGNAYVIGKEKVYIATRRGDVEVFDIKTRHCQGIISRWKDPTLPSISQSALGYGVEGIIIVDERVDSITVVTKVDALIYYEKGDTKPIYHPRLDPARTNVIVGKKNIYTYDANRGIAVWNPKISSEGRVAVHIYSNVHLGYERLMLAEETDSDASFFVYDSNQVYFFAPDALQTYGPSRSLTQTGIKSLSTFTIKDGVMAIGYIREKEESAGAPPEHKERKESKEGKRAHSVTSSAASSSAPAGLAHRKPIPIHPKDKFNGGVAIGEVPSLGSGETLVLCDVASIVLPADPSRNRGDRAVRITTTMHHDALRDILDRFGLVEEAHSSGPIVRVPPEIHHLHFHENGLLVGSEKSKELIFAQF